jgi:hypothetical protein
MCMSNGCKNESEWRTKIVIRTQVRNAARQLKVEKFDLYVSIELCTDCTRKLRSPDHFFPQAKIAEFEQQALKHNSNSMILKTSVEYYPIGGKEDLDIEANKKRKAEGQRTTS